MKKTNFLEFESRPAHDGIQYLSFFDNGYGVSIVKHGFSYGHESDLWELAVLKGNKDGWHICYHTNIASDVLGYLEKDEVNQIVDNIEALPYAEIESTVSESAED